jgi:hypothetical protein
MRAITKFAGAAVAVVIAGGAATSAQAAIFISLDSGGGITQVASGTDFASYAGLFGGFEINLVQGSSGLSPVVLNSGSINTSATDAATLDVYVSRNDVAGPLPLSTFVSGFTSNFLSAGSTLRVRTYIDSGNVVNGTGTQIGDHTFVGTGSLAAVSAGDVFGVPAMAGPYSVTAHYTISTGAFGGTSDATISVAVPEPGTWALMILGFGSAGAMLRSRRRSQALA